MKKSWILAVALLAAACSPQVYPLYMDVRQPSTSGLKLAGKNISIVYMDGASPADSLFDRQAASALARSLEEDYLDGREEIGIFRTARADSVSLELMHSLVMETEGDVVFVLSSELGEPQMETNMQVHNAKSADSAYVCPAVIPIKTQLYVYDSMGQDKVHHFRGSATMRPRVFNSGTSSPEALKALAEEEGEPTDDDPPSPEPSGDAPELPDLEVLEAAVQQGKYRRRLYRMIRTTIATLITVAAVAVLVAVLLMPVLQIYGSSMSPSLSEGEYVLTVKTGEMKTGDIVAFYYNNKVLVKRVIGQPGQWIDIDQEGNVYVDNVLIDESYLPEGAKAFGECNIQLPYQVPEARVFVMGDNRAVSVDSRSTTVGCVSEEQLVGRAVWCIWPITQARHIY